jgi:hypothetical protein
MTLATVGQAGADASAKRPRQPIKAPSTVKRF